MFIYNIACFTDVLFLFFSPIVTINNNLVDTAEMNELY